MRPSFAARRPQGMWQGWLLAALLLLTPFLNAQEPQPVPVLSGRVIDQALTLDHPQREALEQKLAALERSSGAQVVVLIVGSTQPEDIAAYAQRVADGWRIGRRGVGDGLLIVVARDDRRVRIEVAKALEGAIPDLAARQIIDQTLRPAFRSGDYGGGLLKAVDRIAERIRGEGLPAPEGSFAPDASNDRGHAETELPWLSGLNLGSLGIFFFVAVPMAALVITRIFGHKLGGLLATGGGGWLAWQLSHSAFVVVLVAFFTLVIVMLMGIGSAARRLVQRGARGGRWNSPGDWGGGWSSGGGGGSWSSGGGGDSFSSGGGGDFGGGGASGDW